MAAAEWDWLRTALEAGSVLVSGAVGAVVGAWNRGRNSAIAEQQVRDDYDAKIDGLRDQMRDSLAEFEKSADARNDLLVAQFRETLEGIRRQIDDNRLHMEENFVRKDAFREFREEYREDMREIKASIAQVSK